MSFKIYAVNKILEISRGKNLFKEICFKNWYLFFLFVSIDGADLEIVSVDMFYQDEDKKDIILAVTYLKSSVRNQFEY